MSVTPTTNHNTNVNDIRNIAFEYIEGSDRYAYGKYGSFKVIMDMENGFINATHMCKGNDKKKIRQWSDNHTSKAIMNTLSSVTNDGYPSLTNPIKYMIKSNSIPILRGTYFHPKLIPHVAMWYSPQYAIKVSEIMIQYHVKEANDAHAKAIKAKDMEISDMVNRFDIATKENRDHFNKAMALSEKRYKKLLEKLDDANYINADSNNKLSNIKEEVLIVKEEVSLVTKKLNISTQDRVPKTANLNKLSELTIIRYYTPNNNTKKFVINAKYYVIRTQRCSLSTAMKKAKTNFPGYKSIYKSGYSPNAINLWLRIKEKLGQHMIVKGNNFTIKHSKEMNRTIFLEEVSKIRDEMFFVQV